MALEIRDAVSELAARWRRKGSRPRPGNRDRPRLRDARPDRLRRPLRLRRHRQRHQSGRAAVLGRRALAGTGHRPRARAPSSTWPSSEMVGDVQPKGFSRSVRVHNISATQGRQVGEHMTQLETPSQHSRQLSQLDEDERYRCFDDLQLTMPNVWESMRLDLEDESVVVVPVDQHRTHHARRAAPSCRRWRNAHCSSCCCSASRGCA